MPDVTRIIEQNATESIYNDDWAMIDRPTEGEDGGTRKILVSRLKELLCGDYIADEWVAGETYTNGAIVSHEGKLYYNNSGGSLVHTTFNSNSWLEVKIDELLEKVISSIGEKWRRVDTYHYDDLVVYGGRLYRCIKNESTQGTWVSNEWIEANAEYYFKKVREYIARYGFVPSREAVSSPYNKGDLILYRAPGDTTNSLYMRLNDTENGDPTWIPENWLKVENIGGALSKIYDDMEESSCDVQIKEQSIVDENNVADLTSLAAVGSASGAIASFDDGSALPMPSLKVSIEPVQSGSGDPSPDNIRPISGWDEVNVVRCGVNLWDEDWEHGYYNRSNGNKAGDTYTTYFRCKNYILCTPNTQYYFKSPTIHASNDSYFALLWYDQNKNFISSSYNVGTNPIQTSPNNAYYVTFYIEVGTSGATYNNDISINYPSTDTSYHAYNGNTYTIDLDGTRYGGTLDVISGELVVDRGYFKYINVSTTSGTAVADGWRCNFTCPTDDINRGKWSIQTGATPIFNKISVVAKGYGANEYTVTLPNVTSKQEADAMLEGLEICYKLANPITYQLTPTQVKSLLGVNNIWTDTGDVLDAEYIRDMTTIINSLIARIEALENQ